MIQVAIIKVFDGPRHERLRELWNCIAEYERHRIRLWWFPNMGNWSHAECFNRMWRQDESSRLVLTEHDWLPDLNFHDPWLQDALDDDLDLQVVGCCYAKRNAVRKFINYQNKLGGWFLSFARDRCPLALDFHGDLDPATSLAEKLNAGLIPGYDAYPIHVGAEYPHGTHLFWSRHIHDPPEMRVSGFRLGEIQDKHDRRVARWLKEQPQDFQQLVHKRLGPDVLGSSSECTDVRSIFDESGARYDAWLAEQPFR